MSYFVGTTLLLNLEMQTNSAHWLEVKSCHLFIVMIFRFIDPFGHHAVICMDAATATISEIQDACLAK